MQTLVYSTQAYHYLGEEVLSCSDWLAGEIVSKRFPDGEIYHRFTQDVANHHAILIGGTIDDINTIELYDLAQGLAHSNARSLTIVIPYFGYATMERAVERGEVVKAKNRALLFSSIPMCAESNHVYLMDIHSEGIPYYFDRDIHTGHIYCKKIIMEAARELCGDDFVMAATDAGRAKWVESLADELKVRSAFVYKHRESGSDTRVTGVNADVQGKCVVIYDDMIRTGGSLMQAAQAYHEKGASAIYAVTTHGLFTDHALDKIEAQGLIRKVIAGNTHPLALQQNHKILEVKSVAGLIFDAIKD